MACSRKRNKVLDHFQNRTSIALKFPQQLLSYLLFLCNWSLPPEVKNVLWCGVELTSFSKWVNSYLQNNRRIDDKKSPKKQIQFRSFAITRRSRPHPHMFCIKTFTPFYSLEKFLNLGLQQLLTACTSVFIIWQAKFIVTSTIKYKLLNIRRRKKWWRTDRQTDRQNFLL